MSLTRKNLFRTGKLKFPFYWQNTSIEIALQNILSKNGIKFETQKVIDNFVQCDIFIEPNIIIFCDGCFWHGCQVCFPKKELYKESQNKTIIRDVLVNQYFRQHTEYIVLRFWEHQINKDINKVITAINQIYKGKHAICR